MIMKMKEVLGRSDMSVEKGRELDEVFAPWVVGNKAKRLGPKQKDHLASQVGTSVENIQDYWLCYRRKYLKKVKRTVLFSIGILCEHNFPQAKRQNISWTAWKDKVPRCVNRTKRNGKEIFDHNCESTGNQVISYYGWPAMRDALLLLSDHGLVGLFKVFLLLLAILCK